MTERLIRPATPADADALAVCHVTCWREAYAHLLSPQFLAALSVEQRRDMWATVLTLEDRKACVAEVDGEIVGFSGTRPGGDGPRELALWGIYLLRRFHGSGLAQQLLDAAIGDEPAFLWVAEDNPRARAFYQRNRFRLDGHRDVEEDWEDMVVVRMVR